MAAPEIIPMLSMTNSHFPDNVTERTDAEKRKRKPCAQKILKVVLLCLAFVAMFIFFKIGVSSYTSSKRTKRGNDTNEGAYTCENIPTIILLDWHKAQSEIFKHQILIDELQKFANNEITLHGLTKSFGELTGRSDLVALQNTLKDILNKEGILSAMRAKKLIKLSVKNVTTGRSFVNWSQASELVWKWANGHIDLLTKENRKLLYMVAHDPDSKPSKTGEVSRDAIYKFKAKNQQLLCEMRKFSKYEDYIKSKNNNVEIKSEPDDAEPQIPVRKRPHASGTGENLDGPSVEVPILEPASKRCRISNNCNESESSAGLLQIGNAYRQGLLGRDEVVDLLSGIFIDEGPADISQAMERSGFDLAVRGLISSRIGSQLSSDRLNAKHVSGQTKNSEIQPPLVVQPGSLVPVSPGTNVQIVLPAGTSVTVPSSSAENQEILLPPGTSISILPNSPESQPVAESSTSNVSITPYQTNESQCSFGIKYPPTSRSESAESIDIGQDPLSNLATQPESVPFYKYSIAYPNLTSDDLDFSESLLQIWNGVNTNNIYYGDDNQEITTNVIKSLQIGTNISSEIIQLFFNLLEKKSKFCTDETCTKNITVVNPAFYQNNFGEVAESNKVSKNPFRNTATTNFELSPTLTLFPTLIFFSHFVLFAFDRSTNELTYYDSLFDSTLDPSKYLSGRNPQTNKERAENRLNAIANLISETKQIQSIKKRIVEVPRTALNDCGPSVILNSYLIFHKKPLNYKVDEEVIEFLRLQIGVCILSSKLKLEIPSCSEMSVLEQRLLETAEHVVLSQNDLINMLANPSYSQENLQNDSLFAPLSSPTSRPPLASPSSSDNDYINGLVERIEALFQKRSEEETSAESKIWLLNARELTILIAVVPKNIRIKAYQIIGKSDMQDRDLDSLMLRLISLISAHWSFKLRNQPLLPIWRECLNNSELTRRTAQSMYPEMRKKMLDDAKSKIDNFANDNKGLIEHTLLFWLEQLVRLKATTELVHYDRAKNEIAEIKAFPFFQSVYVLREFYTGGIMSEKRRTTFYRICETLSGDSERDHNKIFDTRFTRKLVAFFQKFPLELGLTCKSNAQLSGELEITSTVDSTKTAKSGLDRITNISDDLYPYRISRCPPFMMVVEKDSQLSFLVQNGITNRYRNGLFLTGAGRPGWSTLFFLKFIERECQETKLVYLSDPNPLGISIMANYKFGARSATESEYGNRGGYLMTVQTPFAACAKLNWIAIRPTDIGTLNKTDVSTGKAWSKYDNSIIFNLLNFFKKEAQNDLVKELEFYLTGKENQQIIINSSKEIAKELKKIQFENIKKEAMIKLIEKKLDNI